MSDSAKALNEEVEKECRQVKQAHQEWDVVEAPSYMNLLETAATAGAASRPR